MAGQNINRITMTGNLTRDPEMRQTGGGLSICSMRIASNGRKKDQSGQWVDDPGYFDVTVFGGQAEACQRFLAKGRPIAIDGRLKWREWKTDDGQKRQAYEIVADNVQFLGGGEGGGNGSGGGGQQSMGASGGSGGYGQLGGMDNDTSDFHPAPAAASSGGADIDDIPFKNVEVGWDSVKGIERTR